MKVLLTGASGFLGSHILDHLVARQPSTVVLLRPSSPRRFLVQNLDRIEIRAGSLEDSGSLSAALVGVTHVIHSAGLTRGRRNADFFQVNFQGTKTLVEAINQRAGQIERFVHISSLAASGPGTRAAPGRESSPPHPVSVYGQSKLAGELEVVEHCRAAFTVLRPPGVYGPRDPEFLKLFKAVAAHVRPEFGGGRQELSLAFGPDLAKVAVSCLEHPGAAGKVFNAAGSEVVTSGELGELIAAELGVGTVRLALPTIALWPVCLAREMISRLGGGPSVLGLQKYAELAAPGWVCDVSRLRDELRLSCPTTVAQGIAETAKWYRKEGWL